MGEPLNDDELDDDELDALDGIDVKTENTPHSEPFLFWRFTTVAYVKKMGHGAP